MTIILQSLLLTVPAVLRASPMLVLIAAAWLAAAFAAALFSRYGMFYFFLILAMNHHGLHVARATLALKKAAGPLRRGRLSEAAVYYTILETVVSGAIILVGMLAVLTVMKETGGNMLSMRAGGRQALDDAMNASPVLIAVYLAFLGLATAFSAALLVPKAAAAAGNDERGRRREFFSGFGSHFVPLFVICAAASAAFSFDPIAPAIMRLVTGFFTFASGPHDYSGSTMPGVGDPVQPGDWLLLLVAAMLVAWVYTAAAVAFLALQNESSPDRSAKVALAQSNPTDLRNLRKSRQQ